MSAGFWTAQLLAMAATTVVDLAAKLGLLVLAACVAERAFRRSAPEVRHRLWLVVAVGALALVLGDFFPQYGWRFVARPALPTDQSALLAPTARALGVVSIWALGALLALACYVRGTLHLRALVRRAEPVRDRAWTTLLRRLARELGVRSRVRLLRAEDVGVPVTFRARGDVIVLPAGAEEWTVERRRVVLLHELAHIRRRDHRVERVLAAVCTLFWFHPGAWLTARRVRLERERACDREVVRHGRVRASDYAEHLVGIARDFIGLPYGALVTADAMAHTSTLEQRLRSILEVRRGSAPTGHRLLIPGLAAAILWFAVTPILPFPCLEQAAGVRTAGTTAPAHATAPAASSRGARSDPRHAAGVAHAQRLPVRPTG